MNKYLILFVLFFPLLSASALKINEISVGNVSMELDPDYDFSPWVELYNDSTVPVNIKGLYFSDEEGNPQKYSLKEDREIPAGGYAVVWENDELSDGKGVYFDMDMDGGYISVSDVDGNILDYIEYPEQYTNVSYGRTTDGEDEFGYFIKPSLKSSNNGSLTGTGVAATPVFSVESGFYSTGLTVDISCSTTDAVIYYTTDGSVPTKEDKKYSGEITISKTTSIRAKAFVDGSLDGYAASATYMINERKPDLPVVFFVVDTSYLFNDTIGIYCVGTNGISGSGAAGIGNYNHDWTRYSNFEFYDKGELKINQNVGIEISGHGSRGYPQKSLKVKSGKKYGKKNIDYEFFPDKPGRKFKSILLRAGGQQYISGFIIRDAVMQQLCSAFPLPYQAYLPAVLYINGKYWGIHNIRERNSADNIYSNYGLDKDEIDLLNYDWYLVVSEGNI